MTTTTADLHPAPAEGAVCTWCPAPATTTRPTGVSTYFVPREDTPRLPFCEAHGLQSDRDVRDVHLDWANDW